MNVLSLFNAQWPLTTRRGNREDDADNLASHCASRKADQYRQAHEDVAHNALGEQHEELAQRVYEAVWFIAEERDL